MQGSTAAGATSQADLVKVAGTAGRIFFVTRYFAPDQSATSQLLSQVACDLASAGCKVEVVTSRHLYDNPKARLLCNEIVDGVESPPSRLDTIRPEGSVRQSVAITHVFMLWPIAFC